MTPEYEVVFSRAARRALERDLPEKIAAAAFEFIAGALRGLPLGWQAIDVSFGVVAALPLAVALVATRRLEALPTASAASPAVAR